MEEARNLPESAHNLMQIAQPGFQTMAKHILNGESIDSAGKTRCLTVPAWERAVGVQQTGFSLASSKWKVAGDGRDRTTSSIVHSTLPSVGVDHSSSQTLATGEESLFPLCKILSLIKKSWRSFSKIKSMTTTTISHQVA